VSSIYFIPPGTNFNPEKPTLTDLNNAVNLTNYTSNDGIRISPDEALRNQIRRMADQLRAMGLTAIDASQLVEALAAESKAKPMVRQMNTNMKYPTSTPPWARRQR